jgi:hypothetical protein
LNGTTAIDGLFGRANSGSAGPLYGGESQLFEANEPTNIWEGNTLHGVLIGPNGAPRG